MCVCENRQWQLSVVRPSPRLVSAAAAAARTRRRRSLARRLATPYWVTLVQDPWRRWRSAVGRSRRSTRVDRGLRESGRCATLSGGLVLLLVLLLVQMLLLVRLSDSTRRARRGRASWEADAAGGVAGGSGGGSRVEVEAGGCGGPLTTSWRR